MECDICRRPHDAQRQPFLCAVDARNKIYEGRMKQLELLLENESLQSQISQLLDDASKPGSRGAQETALAQRYMAEQRTEQILQAADKLREEIQAARQEIHARKASLARRRSDLASVSTGLAERRAKQQKEIEKSINILKFRWAQSAEDMAATRAFLCTEAVRLYGLKRSSSRKGGAAHYEYHLGKVPVVDLTAMDSLPPEIISTSLAHIAHILILISHYLSIRLPAEITLPHRDYPRPTIFNLQSSYHHGDVFFPGAPVATTPLVDTPGFNSHVPRPRPLFIEKPLPQLSKEDPATYSLFLEGVTLLAYNIAWLCCSQGVSVGDKSSFEDICSMGRNLYGLLMNNQTHRTSNSAAHPSNADSNTNGQGADADQNWVGRYSHGTTYYYLGGPDGTEFVKSFKIPNPVKLADKLKKKLIGDAPAPDWEVLDDDAWREDGASNGVLKTNGLADKVGNLGSPRSSSDGWMKVRNRS